MEENEDQYVKVFRETSISIRITLKILSQISDLVVVGRVCAFFTNTMLKKLKPLAVHCSKVIPQLTTVENGG